MHFVTLIVAVFAGIAVGYAIRARRPQSGKMIIIQDAFGRERLLTELETYEQIIRKFGL